MKRKMKNKHLENLSKIEFVVTDKCTGRCKHCSEGDHPSCGPNIDPDVAAYAVRQVASIYDIKTVMTFGGEPLLHPEAVYNIMSCARDLCIPKRQVITNGFFSKNAARISEVIEGLKSSGVNDLLLSVDAFHQETIHLDTVMLFAKEAALQKLPIRLQPAWLRSPSDENPYNKITKSIIKSFDGLGIPCGEGNVVFFEGNAKIYLSEYFKDELPQNPYTEDPCNIKCLSFAANGDVLQGNIYKNDILEIINNYTP